MIWDNETTEMLRTLWEQGHSTAEIGRRMGFSKNAIVGRSHRLNLSERPSPIRRGVTPERRVPSIAPAGRVTLPALANTTTALFVRTWSEPAMSPENQSRIRTMHANGMGYKAICQKTGISNYFVRRALGYRKPQPVAGAPVVRMAQPVAPLIVAVKPVFVAPVSVPPAVPPRTPDAGQCQWLHGSRPYVQCTEMALAGEGVARPWSYCEAHRSVCFVRRRECAA